MTIDESRFFHFFARWGQPGQQQELRLPSLSCERPTLLRFSLVSVFFTEVTQQTQSLRAKGEILFQTALALVLVSKASRKSRGIECKNSLRSVCATVISSYMEWV